MRPASVVPDGSPDDAARDVRLRLGEPAQQGEQVQQRDSATATAFPDPRPRRCRPGCPRSAARRQVDPGQARPRTAGPCAASSRPSARRRWSLPIGHSTSTARARPAPRTGTSTISIARPPDVVERRGEGSAQGGEPAAHQSDPHAPQWITARGVTSSRVGRRSARASSTARAHRGPRPVRARPGQPARRGDDGAVGEAGAVEAEAVGQLERGASRGRCERAAARRPGRSTGPSPARARSPPPRARRGRRGPPSGVRATERPRSTATASAPDRAEQRQRRRRVAAVHDHPRRAGLPGRGRRASASAARASAPGTVPDRAVARRGGQRAGEDGGQGRLVDLDDDGGARPPAELRDVDPQRPRRGSRRTRRRRPGR